MADLDDFFAKKDKKKGKSKKFMSSEELVKQITEQAAKEKELKKPAKIEEEQEPSKANQEVNVGRIRVPKAYSSPLTVSVSRARMSGRSSWRKRNVLISLTLN